MTSRAAGSLVRPSQGGKEKGIHEHLHANGLDNPEALSECSTKTEVGDSREQNSCLPSIHDLQKSRQPRLFRDYSVRMVACVLCDLCVSVGTHLAPHTWGGPRTALWSGFSPSTMGSRNRTGVRFGGDVIQSHLPGPGAGCQLLSYLPGSDHYFSFLSWS